MTLNRGNPTYTTKLLECRAALAERFPAAFVPKGSASKKPLKVGIYLDIRLQAPDLKVSVLRATLHDYTIGSRYLLALQEGAPRVALDGTVAGMVTHEEAAQAALLRTGVDKLDIVLRVLRRVDDHLATVGPILRDLKREDDADACAALRQDIANAYIRRPATHSAAQL